MGYVLRRSCLGLRLTPVQKAVVLAMADYGDEDGSNVYPSFQTISDDTCIAPRAVRTAIKSLERLGILVLVSRSKGGPRQTNRYVFDLARVAELTAAPVEVKGKRKCKKVVAGGATLDGDNMASGATSGRRNVAGGATLGTANHAGGATLDDAANMAGGATFEAANVAWGATDSYSPVIEESYTGGVDSVGGCRGKIPDAEDAPERGRRPRSWSPKIDDPNQLDLVDLVERSRAGNVVQFDPAPAESGGVELGGPAIGYSGVDGEILPPGKSERSGVVVPIRGKRNGTRWPENQPVPMEWIREAQEVRQSAGLPAADMVTEARKFVRYFTGPDCRKPVKKDWRRTWLNWVDNANAWGGSNGNSNGYGRRAISGLAAVILSEYGGNFSDSE